MAKTEEDEHYDDNNDAVLRVTAGVPEGSTETASEPDRPAHRRGQDRARLPQLQVSLSVPPLPPPPHSPRPPYTLYPGSVSPPVLYLLLRTAVFVLEV